MNTVVIVFLNVPSKNGDRPLDRFDGLYKDFETAERLLKEHYDWLDDWKTEPGGGPRSRYISVRHPDGEDWHFRLHLEDVQEIE